VGEYETANLKGLASPGYLACAFLSVQDCPDRSKAHSSLDALKGHLKDSDIRIASSMKMVLVSETFEAHVEALREVVVGEPFAPSPNNLRADIVSTRLLTTAIYNM
jgi:hypothetical protein